MEPGSVKEVKKKKASGLFRSPPNEETVPMPGSGITLRRAPVSRDRSSRTLCTSFSHRTTSASPCSPPPSFIPPGSPTCCNPGSVPENASSCCFNLLKQYCKCYPTLVRRLVSKCTPAVLRTAVLHSSLEDAAIPTSSLLEQSANPHQERHASVHVRYRHYHHTSTDTRASCRQRLERTLQRLPHIPALAITHKHCPHLLTALTGW